MRKTFLSDLRSVAAKALAAGAARVSPGCIRWICSGDCEKPYITEMYARPSRPHDGKYVVVKNTTAFPLTVELHTRCRECTRCLRHRRILWSERAVMETRASVRSWFGTLTLSPEQQHLALIQAAAHARKRGVDWGSLDDDEKFRRHHAQINREITKYLKRVRSQSGAPLRYLLVAEKHQSGWPHYHMLVHEVSPVNPVRHAVLSEQWRVGFTRWKLVAEYAQSRYLAKYLAKDAVARVRASIDYGNPPNGIAIDHLKQIA